VTSGPPTRTRRLLRAAYRAATILGAERHAAAAWYGLQAWRHRAAGRRWLRTRGEAAGVSLRDGCVVFSNPGNTLVARGPLYEPATREALTALCAIDLLRGGAAQIADLGANIGLHTVFLARRFPNAHIHAYDPSPQSLRYLNATVEYNRLANVTVHRCALGVEVGEAQLFTCGAESSADSLRDTGRFGSRGSADRITVPVTTLDEEWAAGVAPTVIKMDCEGGELDVLRGGAAMIRAVRPLFLLELSPLNMPAFGVAAGDVFAWAGSVGYRILTLGFREVADQGALREAQASDENFILLPEELFTTFTGAAGALHRDAADAGIHYS
jgi:FkbM family methyltransferase